MGINRWNLHQNTLVFIHDITFYSLRSSDGYICGSKLTIIGSDNGLAPTRRWNIVNRALRNTLQWNLDPNSYIFFEENAVENRLRNGVHLTRPQCVKNAVKMSVILCCPLCVKVNDSWCGHFKGSINLIITHQKNLPETTGTVPGYFSWHVLPPWTLPCIAPISAPSAIKRIHLKQ